MGNSHYKSMSEDVHARGNVPETSAPPTPVAWATLSKFVVRVKRQENVVAPVYANGRQEVPVEIEIEARDENGVVVTLTQDQLSYIDMIEYESSQYYHTNYFKNHYCVYEWPVTREGEVGVVPDGEAGEVPVVAGQTAMRYVPLSQVETIWLAAQITSPSGVVLRTNTPNPSPGKFDSWVKVEGRSPKIIHWEEFVISDPEEIFTEDQNWALFMYYIYFKDPSLRIVMDKNYRPHLEHIHYAQKGMEFGVAHVALLVGGSAPTFTYKSCSSMHHSFTFPINARPGQAQACVIFDKLGKNCMPSIEQNGLVGYVDQHGNESQITLKVSKRSGGNRGEVIRLDDPGNVHDVTPDDP